jgi:hypothetical protein
VEEAVSPTGLPQQEHTICNLQSAIALAGVGNPMKFTTMWMGLSSARSYIQGTRIPIIPELLTASWSNWRESFKEAFVTLFFSLMPLWLGLLIVNLLTITDGTSGFIAKFASSSDLGILSASLLGPMLYMMFREDRDASERRIVPRFPSGLWFIMFTVVQSLVASSRQSSIASIMSRVFEDTLTRVDLS